MEKNTFFFLALLLLNLSVLSGCNGLFFHPMQDEVFSPSQLGLQHQELYISTPDGVQLHGWHLQAQGESKGSIVFFHGNAENITTHIASVYWLPTYGFDVYMFDYRGYGRSQGLPSVDGVILDAITVLEFVATTQKQGFVVFGQSLGCAVALNAVSEFPHKDRIKAVVADSCFSGFREIAREKLADVWLTWPFQYPLSYAFTGDHNPLQAVKRINPIPLLVIHGNRDQVIPMHHGVQLYDAARPPKRFWEVDQGRHIDSVMREGVRSQFVDFLQSALNGKISANNDKISKISSPTIFEQKKTQ